jgi:NADH-ubiquinone oxidoreductase chain 6
MVTLIATIDHLANGYLIEVLSLVSLMALLAGIAILGIKNPIAALISLIGLFASIAVYLIYIGLTFIGFSYLIVYIGAVSILFLFILMLINIRNSELLSNNWDSIQLGVFITILFNYALFGLLPYFMTTVNNYSHNLHNISGIVNFNNTPNTTYELSAKSSEIMYVTSSNWDIHLTEISHITSIGNIIYTTYNMWLFIVSFILLLAMVGAIVLTVTSDSNKG